MNTIKEDYKKILSFYKTKKVFAIILGIAILVCLAFAWQELLVLFVIGYSIRLIVKSNKEKKNSDVKKTCPHCKEEVKADATRCPHCHGKIYVWTTGNKIVAGFLSILILFIIISVSGNSNTPTENKKVGHDDIELRIGVTIIPNHVSLLSLFRSHETRRYFKIKLLEIALRGKEQVGPQPERLSKRKSACKSGIFFCWEK